MIQRAEPQLAVEIKLAKAIPLRHLLLILWSVVLSMLTMVLGAAPLFAMKKSFGRTSYGLIVAGLALLFWCVNFRAFALAYFALGLLVMVFDEIEDLGFIRHIWQNEKK